MDLATTAFATPTDPLVSSILKDIQDYASKASRDKFAKSVERTRAWALGSDSKYAYLPLNAGESVSTFKVKPKADRGILEIALQQYLNGVTALPIKRWVPAYPQFSLARYTKHLDPQKIQTATEISGTTAVRPVFTSTGEVSYETFDATQLYPRTQADVLVALGVSYLVGDQDILEIWEPSTYTLVMKGQIQGVYPNPYGQIPFAIFRAGKSDKDWMGISDLGKSVGMDIAISKMMTDAMELARDQSYAWPVYQGDLPEEGDEAAGDRTPSEGLQVGPGRVITIPKDAKFYTVSPEADIASINATIESFTKSAFDKLSILPSDKGSEYSSGFALQVKSSRYLQKVGGKRALYIEGEQQLLELAILMDEVQRTNTPSVLNDDFKVKTEIDADSLNPRTVQEDIAITRFLLDRGLMGPIEEVMNRFNLSREEAEDYLTGVQDQLPTTTAA